MKSRFAHWFISKVSRWLSYELPLTPAYLYDFDKIRFEIRSADVLLVEGRNRISRIVKQMTQSTWSHSALYIGRLHDIDDMQLREHLQKFYHGPPDEQLVIESLMGRGTIITTLSHYKNHNIRICRPRGLSREDAQKIVDFTLHHLGARYSLRHIFDLGRFLFPWGIVPRRWRSTLFVHNALKPTEEICSSLIGTAFKTIHFPILPEVVRDAEGLTLVSRNPRLFTPKDFDCSPFFDIIKYPMLPIISEGIYKYLPWQENKMTGDEFIRLNDSQFNSTQSSSPTENPSNLITPSLPHEEKSFKDSHPYVEDEDPPTDDPQK